MKITRHPVDLERVTKVFQSQLSYLEESLQRVRKAPTGLYLFFCNTETVYQAGSILAPDSPEVARTLKLAAQAGTALFMFQQIENPPRPFVLGEGPPVVYSQPAGSSSADLFTWRKVFNLCVITRQVELSNELCRVSNEVFKHSDIVGAAEADYRFADLLRAVWTQDCFTSHPAFADEEAEYSNASGTTAWARYARYLALPYLQVLRRLEERDELGFTAALAQALKGHKEFWSSGKYRAEFDGFVSLPLTAAAALAWDRGMRFDLESDYMPGSWFRGDQFHSE
jgi:hypothetical protein